MTLFQKKQKQKPGHHSCHPSYSGVRDQENQGSKPAQANSSQDSILKKTHHKKGVG
jgi:hypothetical protein